MRDREDLFESRRQKSKLSSKICAVNYIHLFITKIELILGQKKILRRHSTMQSKINTKKKALVHLRHYTCQKQMTVMHCNMMINYVVVADTN